MNTTRKNLNHLCLLLALFINSCEGNLVSNLIENVEYPKCDLLQKQISYRDIVAPVPLKKSDLQGEWVSQSCETRPGSTHVIRSYTFGLDGKIEVILYTYYDEFCSKPKMSIVAEGHLELRKDSLITPGGTEAEYLMKSLSLVVHTHDGVIELMEELNSSLCSSEVVEKIRPHLRSSLSESSSEPSDEIGISSLRCVPSLFKTWNEFQLLRIEVREILPSDNRWRSTSSPTCKVQELFLGDLHSNPTWQRTYRPTSYQTPLVKTHCLIKCPVCEKTKNASPETPPLLQNEPRIQAPKLMDGSWTSITCEVQRHGLFLTRKITFRRSRPRWSIKQRYFSDPFCRKPSYTIFASGTYKRPVNSSAYEIGQALDMIISKMGITPDDRNFAAQLNRISGRRCGIAGKWRRGKMQDITHTGGCGPVGLKVPSKEPEILRLVSGRDDGQIFMYLGLTPTWPHRGIGLSPRPTAWGPPLQKCSPLPMETNHLRPVVGARVALASAVTSSSHWSYSLSLYLLCLLFVSG